MSSMKLSSLVVAAPASATGTAGLRAGVRAVRASVVGRNVRSRFRHFVEVVLCLRYVLSEVDHWNPVILGFLIVCLGYKLAISTS